MSLKQIQIKYAIMLNLLALDQGLNLPLGLTTLEELVPSHHSLIYGGRDFILRKFNSRYS